jgi:hypothetical protein
MRFTVVWDPAVQDDLAALWLNAENRDEIRRAADTIDRMLVDDADLVRITEVWVGANN